MTDVIWQNVVMNDLRLDRSTRDISLCEHIEIFSVEVFFPTPRQLNDKFTTPWNVNNMFIKFCHTFSMQVGKLGWWTKVKDIPEYTNRILGCQMFPPDFVYHWQHLCRRQPYLNDLLKQKIYNISFISWNGLAPKLWPPRMRQLSGFEAIQTTLGIFRKSHDYFRFSRSENISHKPVSKTHTSIKKLFLYLQVCWNFDL